MVLEPMLPNQSRGHGFSCSAHKTAQVIGSTSSIHFYNTVNLALLACVTALHYPFTYTLQKAPFQLP